MLNLLKGALMALFFFVAPAFAQDEMLFDKERLTVETAAGKTLAFTVEIARTEEQRERGLMFRKAMAPDAGMIFDFAAPRRVTMWMENTILPLDMLFIDDKGIIRHIRKDAVPFSQDIIDSQGPVKFVVELNAGTVERLGIANGDKVNSATIRVQ